MPYRLRGQEAQGEPEDRRAAPRVAGLQKAAFDGLARGGGVQTPAIALLMVSADEDRVLYRVLAGPWARPAQEGRGVLAVLKGVFVFMDEALVPRFGRETRDDALLRLREGLLVAQVMQVKGQERKGGQGGRVKGYGAPETPPCVIASGNGHWRHRNSGKQGGASGKIKTETEEDRPKRYEELPNAARGSDPRRPFTPRRTGERFPHAA